MEAKEKNEAQPIIKFKTSAINSKIERVECLRETGQSVFLVSSGFMARKSGERRAAKHSEWEQYHDTWEAAHAYLLRQAQDEVDACRRRLEGANGRLGQIKGMKKPSGA
jgi:hypothetical protein